MAWYTFVPLVVVLDVLVAILIAIWLERRQAAASIDHVDSSPDNGRSSLMDVVALLVIGFGALTVV